MRKMRFAPYVLLIGLLLVSPGSMRVGLAQGPEPQDRVQPQSDVSVAAVVNNAFSYQGVLREDGNPVTGSRDMTFRLCSDDDCTTQLDSVHKASVQVTEGLFSVQLRGDPYHFNGRGLWLEVEVGGTSLGCQEVIPVPYALSLRPGAMIDSATSAARLAFCAGSPLDGDYRCVGVYGDGGWGVHGHSSGGFGVRGESDGTSGTGVYGEGPDYGVQGAGGIGVHGSGQSVGVEGHTIYGTGVKGTTQDASGYGGSFENTAASGDACGVYGKTDSEEGTAVYGQATASSGTTYGVAGTAESPDGYGGYFMNESSRQDSTGAYGEGAVYGLRGQASGVSDWPHEFPPDVYGVYGEAEIQSDLAGRAIGVGGHGVWGVYGTGSNGGVYGTGPSGVYGSSSSSDGAGVIGWASPSGGHGVVAQGRGSGGDNSALWAEARNEDSGIAIWATAKGDDSTVVLEQDAANGGDFIRAFQTGPNELRFRLRQDGMAYADGGWATPASDFAEMLPAVEGPQPGDVLVIGADGKLHRSDEAGAANVVGVYSTDPGFVGGSAEDGPIPGEVPLAVVGVVPVKATAEGGPIAPGDLLIASSTPGHAMKAGASPELGTVIGKALEALEGTTGVISMLVMLQ